MEFIRLALSQPFLKMKISGLDQKKSIKLCAEHFTTLGVIKYISGHMTVNKLFFVRKVPISLKWSPDRHNYSNNH